MWDFEQLCSVVELMDVFELIDVYSLVKFLLNPMFFSRVVADVVEDTGDLVLVQEELFLFVHVLLFVVFSAATSILNLL